jgi:sigma-B regulation protein RsbU (phosphoserine phosphatase)
MKLELHATPEEVMRGVEALREFARAQCLPEKTIFELSLALEECGSNIVNHAYKRDARQKLTVTVECNGGDISVELRDSGPQFDPTNTQSKPPATEDDPPGGWGIQLVHYYMDELQYKRDGNENVLRLIKQLTPKQNAN